MDIYIYICFLCVCVLKRHVCGTRLCEAGRSLWFCVVMLGGVYGVPLQANMYPHHHHHLLHPGSPAPRMMGPPYQQYPPPPQGQTSPLPPGMHPYPGLPPGSPHAGSPGAPPMFPASPQGVVTGRACHFGVGAPDPSRVRPPAVFSSTVLTLTVPGSFLVSASRACV